MQIKQLGARVLKTVGKPFAAIAQLGMSMIEIMIVISLIGFMMVYLIQNLTKMNDNAKEDLASTGMGLISQNMERYRLDNNKYPTTEQGLAALVTKPGDDVKKWRGPYLDDPAKLNDPWGKPFKYESDGRTFKMTSSGLDEEMDTPDDVIYPKPTGTAAEPAP
jgi:general secretion pathway protein G